MLIVFIKVFTIFAMTGVGYAANKLKVLPDESAVPLTSLLINISTPCLIINSMGGTQLTAQTLRDTISVLVVSACVMFITGLLSILIVKILRWKPVEDQGCVMAILTSINTGFLGFPVAKAVFGNKIFYLFVIQNIVLNFYMYSGLIIQLNFGQKSKLSGKQMLRAMCTMPMFATIAGCIILFARIRLPQPVMTFFSTMGDMTIPLSMVLVGVLLGKSHLASLITNKKLVIICLLADLLMPAISYPLVNWLPISAAAKLTCIYAEAFPCAVITAAIAEQQHKNGQLLSEGIALSTFFSLGTLPLVTVVLMHIYGGLI
ncbi:MAG: AEC family transporter [Eubacterium sp.]